MSISWGQGISYSEKEKNTPKIFETTNKNETIKEKNEDWEITTNKNETKKPEVTESNVYNLRRVRKNNFTISTWIMFGGLVYLLFFTNYLNGNIFGMEINSFIFYATIAIALLTLLKLI